jgi:hypothetical protein
MPEDMFRAIYQDDDEARAMYLAAKARAAFMSRRSDFTGGN